MKNDSLLAHASKINNNYIANVPSEEIRNKKKRQQHFYSRLNIVHLLIFHHGDKWIATNSATPRTTCASISFPYSVHISLSALVVVFFWNAQIELWTGKKRSVNVLKAKKRGKNANPKLHSKWADRHQPLGHTAIYWGQGSHHSLFPLHSFFLLLLFKFPFFFSSNWLVFISFYTKKPFSGKSSQANFQSNEFRTKVFVLAVFQSSRHSYYLKS